MKNFIALIFSLISTIAISQNMAIEKTDANSNQSNVIQSSDTYYNLGINYYHKKEFGKAIWAFESALKVNPSNNEAQQNLDVIASELPNVNIIQSKGIGSWLGNYIYRQSINFWFYVSITTSILTAICLLIFFIPTSRTVNNTSLTFGSLCGLIMIMSFIFSLIHQSHLSNSTKAVIINPITNMYNDPVIDSEIITKISEGNELKILSSQDDWYQLEYNNQKGWIIKDSVLVF